MPRRRIAAALASAVIGLTLLTGCSDDVSCGLDQCTVTVQRETNAKVEVLGVEAKFVSADEDTVTLDVGGEQIQLTKGQQAVEVGGLSFTLSSVTQDAVKIEVAR
jgi:outer membrane murein-binding lipoprotein Lpp